jgi:hypothetical protein
VLIRSDGDAANLLAGNRGGQLLGSGLPAGPRFATTLTDLVEFRRINAEESDASCADR